uniref:Ubiquitin-like domain-containing protein n=1 Tax=Plectus sambesii TaxID=2011161 RepID=A0A914X975_9BILA
ESWRSANVRERTLLLDLIRRLGVDANESALIEKTLSLLWDLARETDMPLEQMEQALNSMFKILEVPRRNSFRQTYVKKCIDELRNNSNFVVPALKHMQRIFILAPEAPHNYHVGAQQRSMYRHDIISDIQSHEQLCRMLTQNLTAYMEKLREAQTVHPLPSSVDPGDFMLDGRTAHREQLRARLEFLQFVLREGRLWLMMEQAIDLWDSLVVNAVFPYDRNTGFNMFASMQRNDDVDPDSLVQFFETKVLHLEPQLLNDAGLECFESFFKAVNTKENRLISVRAEQYFLNSTDLKGQDYLWQIILSASEEVSNKAIELFRDIYSTPAADISGHLNELNARIIEESIERLKHMYDAIVVESVDSPAVIDQHRICATKMTRTIKALCAYVRAYDDEFLSVERKRCPLHRASLGRCFRLRVRIPVNSFSNASHRPIVGPLNQSVVSSPLAVQDETVEVLVHSHQSLDRLRREVLLRWQMTVNVAPPPKLDLFDGSRLLDASDDRKTLVECGISEMSNMVLKLSNAATTTSSPDSSIESTPADRSPNNELNAPLEQLLPGVAIANLPDGTDFLFKVADLATRLNRTDLRDNAHFLLQLIPADQKVVNELRLAAERQALSSLFFAESPTKVLYFLEVAHSLLMPAQATQECNEFQELFYRANGLRTCLEMLSSEAFMAGADVHTRNLANQSMLRMLKFNLAVAGHLNVDHVLRTTADEGERIAASIYRGILEAVPGYHEHLFRQLCEQMAVRLRDGGLSGELLQFKAKRTELEKLLRLAWTAGSGSTEHTADTPLDAISASYDQQWLRDTTLEQISLSAMDALTLGFVSCAEANELFAQEMWPRFVIDILFSKMLSVRNQAVESIYVILSKICVGPRKTGAL